MAKERHPTRRSCVRFAANIPPPASDIHCSIPPPMPDSRRMALRNLFQRLSQAPTNPHPAAVSRQFDVADLYRGPVAAADDAADDPHASLDEKLRQAYFWI